MPLSHSGRNDRNITQNYLKDLYNKFCSPKSLSGQKVFTSLSHFFCSNNSAVMVGDSRLQKELSVSCQFRGVTNMTIASQRSGGLGPLLGRLLAHLGLALGGQCWPVCPHCPGSISPAVTINNVPWMDRMSPPLSHAHKYIANLLLIVYNF